MNKIINALKSKNRHDLVAQVKNVIADFSDLKLKPGDYVVQKNSNMNIYGYLISLLKNKGFKAIIIDDDRKKAKKGVVSESWYPLPKKIKESNVPPKLLDKIKAKL